MNKMEKKKQSQFFNINNINNQIDQKRKEETKDKYQKWDVCISTDIDSTRTIDIIIVNLDERTHLLKNYIKGYKVMLQSGWNISKTHTG